MMERREKKSRGWIVVLLTAAAIAAVCVAVGSIWIARLRQREGFIQQLQSHDRNLSLTHQRTSSSPPGNRWVRSIAGDNAFAGVASVRLQGEDGRQHLPALSQQADLDTLQLKGACFGDAEMQHVASIKNLDLLRLEDTGVTQTGIAELRRCTSLKSLTLQGEWVNDKTLAGVQNLTQVRGLTIESASITSAGLEHLSNLTQLEYLVISRCKNATGPGLHHLKDLTSLTSLYLPETPLSDADLSVLRRMKNLAYLDISGNAWNSDSAAILATMPSIATLDLDGCDVTDEDMQQIARMTGLKRLYLGRTNVTDTGLQTIAPKLQLDYLCVGPDVTGAGVAAIHQRTPGTWVEVVDNEGFTRAAGDGNPQTAFPTLTP